MERDKRTTRRAVEGMIAEGHTLVIFEESVLRLDSWLKNHPGGRLAILHMVGRDATDEIKVYHSDTTLKTMHAYRIARKPLGTWMNMTPPIRGGVYRKHEKELLVEETTSSSCDSEGDDTDDLLSDNVSESDRTSLTSECSSVFSDQDKPALMQEGVVRRRIPLLKDAHGAQDLHMSDGTMAAGDATISPADYTELAMEREISRDMKDYPSLEPAVQEDIIHKYRALHQRVRDEGLYDCPFFDYGKEMMRYTTLFTLSMVALHYSWYMTSAVFLGLFWHQIMFSAHDAGHGAITHNFTLDSLIAIFVADFCCGLSMGWWKSSHNVHHLITNHPEHDPDIQNVPLFATSPSFFKSLHSTYYDFTYVWDKAAEVLVPYQKYTYYPIMGVARFNLYILSWLHVLSSKSSQLGASKAWWIRPTEIACMAGYWFLFGYRLLYNSIPTWTLRVAFVLVSHIVTMPLHVQITLSHWGMPTSNLGESESFPQRQLRTTMDVDCPAWLDWIHGGLQFQAVHHLFPRVPRHNLRKVQVLVREFCKETGIPYAILGFKEGNERVLGRLGEVAEQAKVMVLCQRYMAETGESGLH